MVHKSFSMEVDGERLIEVLEAFQKRKRISCENLIEMYGTEVSKVLAELVYQELIQVDIYTGIWILKH